MDGLLEEIARARAHVQARRHEQKAASLERCIEMLNGLSSSLDTDAGSPVVADLMRLYEYCSWRLYTVGVKLDTAIIDEVCGLLATIRRGWQGVRAAQA